MTRERRFEILENVKEWQRVNNNMRIKTCFFALYDNRTITGTELDYLLDWMNL
jgi:hypothetical protein